MLRQGTQQGTHAVDNVCAFDGPMMRAYLRASCHVSLDVFCNLRELKMNSSSFLDIYRMVPGIR
jgi:hypothetical protein